MRASELAQYVAIRAEAEGEASERLVDMAISLRVCDVDDDGPEPFFVEATDEELIEVGGRWDRERRRFVGDADSYVILRVPRGSDQEAPARYLATWFRLYSQGRKGGHWDRAALDGFRRVYTLMLIGGRRAGKSLLAVWALAMFCLMQPKAICWAVSPTNERNEELLAALRDVLAFDWSKSSLSRADKTTTFRFINGAVIRCMSGYKADVLRQGRCDLSLYNEGQAMSRQGWRELRGALGDRGGMVMIACNQPRIELGRWVESVYERALAADSPTPLDERAKKFKVKAFAFTYKGNPFVDPEALETMAAEEEDENDYKRDILGQIVPSSLAVLHSWSATESVLRDVPAHWVDVTREETARELGRAADYVVGMDFQADPYMPAAVIKLFRDPLHPTHPEDVIAVVVDEVIVDKAHETDLVDALEGGRPELLAGRWTREGRVDGEGYDPDNCGVVMDASGFFQDGEHKPGKTSEDWLRKAGWRFLNYPIKDKKTNPLVEERASVANVRLKNGAGRRRLFVLAHCVRTIRGMRGWERVAKGAKPKSSGEHVHIVDAVTYPIYRFFARPPARKPKPPTYDRVQRRPQLARRVGF